MGFLAFFRCLIEKIKMNNDDYFRPKNISINNFILWVHLARICSLGDRTNRKNTCLFICQNPSEERYAVNEHQFLNI